MTSSISGIGTIQIMAINSSGLLMRLAETSSQFTDNENAYEIERAIDKIVANDPINIYKKLKLTLEDEDAIKESA